MPLYEYRCEACHTRFTVLQPISAPRTGCECPHCGSTDTKRVVSTFAPQTGPKTSGGSSGGGCAPSGG